MENPHARSAEPESARTVVITRVMDAPARLLFEAYSDPEHVMKWFGPPGYPLTLCEMDFREGGTYRFAMTGPDGKEMTPFVGTYLEIVPNEKIVYDDRFETEGAPTMIVTVTFEEQDGRTTLTIHTLFETVAMKDEHLGLGYEQGVGASLEQLAQVVAAMERRS